MRVVNDATERRELGSDIDVQVLVETLMVVLCGVGLYAAYTRNHQGISAIVDMVVQLLEGGLRPTEPKDSRRAATQVSQPSNWVTVCYSLTLLLGTAPRTKARTRRRCRAPTGHNAWAVKQVDVRGRVWTKPRRYRQCNETWSASYSCRSSGVGDGVVTDL